MPVKKYQKDPDSDEEDQTEQKEVEPKGVEDHTEQVESLKPRRGHPKGTKNKKPVVYVAPEKIVEMVSKNELKLTKGQQKALLPKRTRTINDKERQRLIEMGKKGREAMMANKAKRDEEKLEKKLAEQKRQELINAKKIRIEKPERKKRTNFKQPLKNTFKKSMTKGVEGALPLVEQNEDEEYESDSDDSEGYSTDTRAIKKVSKKIKQINQVLQPQPQPQPVQRSYKELSLLDKLNLRF